MKVRIKKVVIEVEVADNFFKQSKGLMFRKRLEENRGMLFVFKRESYPRFWMLGMRFPIDIIWINEEMEIIDITTGANPSFNPYRTYMPKKPCRYVLEVESGFAERNKIEVGMSVHSDKNKENW